MQNTEYDEILRWIQTYGEYSIKCFSQEATSHDSQEMIIDMPKTILESPQFPLRFSVDVKQLVYISVPEAVTNSIGLFTLSSLISYFSNEHSHQQKVKDFFDESKSEYTRRLDNFCTIYVALKYGVLQDICMRKIFEKNVEQMRSDSENDATISVQLPESTINLIAKRFRLDKDQITEVCAKVCLMLDLQELCVLDSALCVRRDVFIQSIPVAIFIALHMPKNEIYGSWNFNEIPNLPRYVIAAIRDNFRINTFSKLLTDDEMENVLLKCNYKFLLMQYIILAQDGNVCRALSSRDGGMGKYKKRAENPKTVSVPFPSNFSYKKQKSNVDDDCNTIDTLPALLSVIQYTSLYDDGKCRISDLNIFLKILDGCVVKNNNKRIIINQSANIMMFNSLTGYIALLDSERGEVSNFLYTHAIAQQLPIGINATDINTLIIQVIKDLKHCTFKLNEEINPDGYFELCENLLHRQEPRAKIMTDDT